MTAVAPCHAGLGVEDAEQRHNKRGVDPRKILSMFAGCLGAISSHQSMQSAAVFLTCGGSM